MKKIQVCVSVAAFALMVCGCGKTPLEVPVVEDGWDVYTGGIYRYGPSIIINDDASLDIWFAAPGAVYGKNVELFHKEADKTAMSVEGKTTVGQKFTIDRPFWAVTATSPTWHSSSCGLTFSLYAWDDQRSYAENVKKEPLAKATFTNYKDGQNIGVSQDDKFPAGTYVWELSEGKTPQSGVWWSSGEMEGVASYKNGELQPGGNWAAQCVEEKSSGDYFWDQASYQHSTDGGKTWTPEKMVLLPTEFSSDHFSVCDPGVAKWGDYYYIGYTSTENEGMVENHVYICRSTSPEGPWEKWNGTGWTTGTDVQPMIRYTDDPKAFGAGEPSIVVLKDTVYFYYTWNATGDEATTTRLVTADAKDPNWPAHLNYHGTVINKSAIKGADHCDVKYRDDIQKFQAIHTANRMGPKSYILLWESEDGIHFTQKAEMRDNLKPYLHNCGWSGDAQGHMRKGVTQYIAYAYGSPTAAWGQWNTWFSPLKLTD